MQAITFAELAFGGLLLTSSLTGESLGELFTKGITETGKMKLHAKREGQAGALTAESASGTVAKVSGVSVVSPFPKGVAIQWGRSDQGVDGVVPPGTPLRAIGTGIIQIAHDPAGFGSNYPVLHLTNGESYYYGHSIPLKANGAKVNAGEIIAKANEHGQGNATTPGAFEIGKWPPGNFATAGAEIRSWLTKLLRL